MSESFWCSFIKPEQHQTSLNPSTLRMQNVIEDKPLPNPIRKWGNQNFQFNYRFQRSSTSFDKAARVVDLFTASILIADAEEPSGLKIPIKCKWFRTKGSFCKQIKEITSNVYQLSSMDLGYNIRVEAEALDSEEYSGTAMGEFGPVQLDIAAKYNLEQILGAGGEQFAISVLYNDGGSSFDMKEESEEAMLFINQNMMRLSLKNHQHLAQMSSRGAGGSRSGSTLSFKYTIDYPKIQLDPFDNKRLSILFNDTANEPSTAFDNFISTLEDSVADTGQSMTQSMVEQHRFQKQLSIRTLSRESREIICLVLKCFSAQSYFVNSKVISDVQDQKTCDFITANSKHPSTLDRVYHMSDVLLELEFVKHDLNEQLKQVDSSKQEAAKYKSMFGDLEEEMACTIESYKAIIDQFQKGDETNVSSLKKEISAMQAQIASLESQRNKLINSQKILEDDKNFQLQRIKSLEAKNDTLNETLELVQQQMGVPKDKYDQLKVQLAKAAEQVAALKEACALSSQKDRALKQKQSEFEAASNALLGVQESNQKLSKEIIELKYQLQLSEDRAQKAFSEAQLAVVHQADPKQEQVLEELKRINEDLQEQNDALLTQRKSLQKQKEGLSKDLQKILREKSSLQKQHEDAQSKQEQEMATEVSKLQASITTLKNANDRLQQQLSDQFAHAEKMETEARRLSQKLKEQEALKREKADKMTMVSSQMLKTISEQMTQTPPGPVHYDQEVQVDTFEPSAPTEASESHKENKEGVDEAMLTSLMTTLFEKETMLKEAEEAKHSLESQIEELFRQEEFKENQRNKKLSSLNGELKLKDATISDLQGQLGKVMERLCEAEQKLFEIQDSFTEDSRSQRSMAIEDQMNVSRTSMTGGRIKAQAPSLQKFDSMSQMKKDGGLRF